MSDMYQKEVPLYGELLEIVRSINREFLSRHPALEQELGSLDRVSEERHGAIRLGLGEELRTMAAVFRVMAMLPVGYYDLSVAGLPVHSTAFRPVEKSELARNPFRVFTSLLRLDLLETGVREEAESILRQRDIFTPELRRLLAHCQSRGGLTEPEASCFVEESLKTFQWHTEAVVPIAFYERMLKINSLLADIVCFRGPHINHLTPRVLDIYQVHRTMQGMGIEVIPEVQGPPESCPILLKQTSFKALNEAIRFPGSDGEMVEGRHRARFGEIELRDCALKPEGRAIYDRLVAEVADRAKRLKKELPEPDYFPAYTAALDEVFQKGFPAWTLEALRTENLGYFRYELKPVSERPPGPLPPSMATLERPELLRQLHAQGWINAIPVTYEDFLPVSAAGIFKSNLDKNSGSIDREAPNQEKFESELGRPVLDPFALYQKEESASIDAVFNALGCGVAQPPPSEAGPL